MNIYPFYAFLSVSLFALVHLFASRIRKNKLQGTLLSFGGGVAISYIFIDLLPKLGKSDEAVEKALRGSLPFLERHVFIMALLGFLLFYLVDKSSQIKQSSFSFWLSTLSYSLFNFFVGYAVVDENDPEVQPLVLFTFAMALHYFTTDYSLNEKHGKLYKHKEKWLLIASIFLGWLAGYYFDLSETAIALISAFIGGGVIMNVIRHELPENKNNDIRAFVLGALFYTFILLFLN